MGEGELIGCECHLCIYARLLRLLYAKPFPLHSLVVRVHREVPTVEGILGQKHIALGALEVGFVTPLQDHDCVLHVVE